MKQTLAQEKAWDMIRGADTAGGVIVSALIHVQVSEGVESVDFFETIRKLVGEGFSQPRGRLVVVWGERAMNIENSGSLRLYYGAIKPKQLLTTCRNLAGKSGFGESGRLQVTCSIEFPERNRIVVLYNLSYPARGGDCIADTKPLNPFKAVSSTGEYTFPNVQELKEFLKKVKNAETYVFDEKTGKWTRWIEVEHSQDDLVINIPTQSGTRQVHVDLKSGKVKEKK